MNRFLTKKGSKIDWWEGPVMVLSGLLTAIGVYVVATDMAVEGDFFITLLAAVLFLGFLSWPLILTLRKRLRRSQAKKLAHCLAKVNGSSITYGELGRRSGVRMPEDKLQWMLGKGWFQNIALDDGHVCVRLTGDSEPEDETPEPPPKPVFVTGSSVYDEKLREIRELNERIDDKDVSDKIDRIEALTADIFEKIVEQPERAAEIRRFMNYYLPTTFKLLESYSLMERQRYQGENIRASRARIEAVLDQIIRAIERQQDKLFQSDALDVETDITVLKTMMSADGLSEDGGLHMQSQGG